MLKEIFITEFDLTRLNALIADAKANRGSKKHLQGLEEELSRANVVDSRDIPPDVVTMNSQIRLKDVDTGEKMTLRLVFPQDADVNQDRISVLAPVGTAIIGFKVGDIAEWPVPSGIRRLQIMEIVYQPEAAGDFDL